MNTHPDIFERRHIGPSEEETRAMLKEMGFHSLEQWMDQAATSSIRRKNALKFFEAQSEHEILVELKTIAAENKIFRSYIGMGYYGTILPPVIQRNILENPGWYTQYTPYQAEIAQGRLEALLNFQTMIADLTAMEIANASLLDEATAAAEAMTMCRAACEDAKRNTFLISELCHPQTIAVVQTRARALGIKVKIGNHADFDFSKAFGILLQYPATNGVILDYESVIEQAHRDGVLAVVATDILALTVLRPPGEFGADVVVGSSQRFGMPMGFGGPHAAFFATREKFKRQMPGRLVGVSKDASGKKALRLALQTREQHIRREKATSNICTAEVLPAVVASMYAVYHGPEQLKKIAEKVHALAGVFALGVERLGHAVISKEFFDTVGVRVKGESVSQILSRAKKQKINLRKLDSQTLSIAFDETVSLGDVAELLRVFNQGIDIAFDLNHLFSEISKIPFPRKSEYLQYEVFHRHHSETAMLRYMKKLENKDISLAHSMIPLGSCTMKLNPTAAMMPVTWSEFANLHPFAPLNQATGFLKLFKELENILADITGLPAVSLQPNAGSQGEYAGLLSIRQYHKNIQQTQRNICLIPSSAHGTNPASATMAGFQVVVVQCDDEGNVDLEDLKKKAEEHQKNLAACMITYPSTHGVFEEGIREICRIVHENGGQVYMDGANMNAMVGLCAPGELGVDVCHLNLHKTFAIPHGGGGPGMGPICVGEHLRDCLPGHPILGNRKSNTVSAAPWGSALVLAIPWVYIRLMGSDGLTRATQFAILNANYVAQRLANYFPVLYRGKNGFVAHECILDFRAYKEKGIEVEDAAKRLMDFGFHAPTISFPVPGTMMIEPTESESKEELDRFCEAMIQIHAEIKMVADGKIDTKDNPLKNAPHTAECIVANEWNHPYSREEAAYPLPWVRENKFWPAVHRVDNVYGDRNLFCSCER
ncbi:MAG: aminomethyl-transferring glycine dehydrogenase [Verrucomicrobiota bacterium]